MILGFKHLLKHNMFKTQGKAPAGGEAKQAEIATTQIPSYRNLPQSCMKNQLCYTGEKLMFLFNLMGYYSLLDLFMTRGFFCVLKRMNRI